MATELGIRSGRTDSTLESEELRMHALCSKTGCELAVQRVVSCVRARRRIAVMRALVQL